MCVTPLASRTLSDSDSHDDFFESESLIDEDDLGFFKYMDEEYP